SIIAPGGSITLDAQSNTDFNGFAQAGQPAVTSISPSKSVWLGSDAVLDVAGIALTDPLAGLANVEGLYTTPVSGRVWEGGSVAFASDPGAVVMQAGSVIDVSGPSAVFDLPQVTTQHLGGVVYVPQQVAGNAGSITLAASDGLYADSTIKAQPGAAT